jgi:TPR repeat protein
LTSADHRCARESDDIVGLFGAGGWETRFEMNATTPSRSNRSAPQGRAAIVRGGLGGPADGHPGRALAAISEGVDVFKKTPCVADLKPRGRDLAKHMRDLGIMENPDGRAVDHWTLDRKRSVDGRATRLRPHASLPASVASGSLPGRSERPSVALLPAPAGRTRNHVMRIIERTFLVAIVLGAASVAVPSLAFDGAPVGSDATMPMVSALPGTAPILKKSAKPETSLTALQYAAEGGHPIAQWKLGRMYADGNGVAQDDLRAFEYFSRIANAHAEDSPSAPQATIVANAFVALGRYYLDGIPNSRVKVDTERAREMFSYAASYFGNADAQYDLARLYLKGIGAPRDTKYGVRWLGLAAQKGQHQAQALLGQMLFNGEALPRQMARGLMWLTLARDNAAPDEVWIQESYNRAISKASEDDRAMALQMIEHWVQGRKD